MSIWFPLHSYSLPTPRQWVALNERVLILYAHGLVMIDQKLETSFLSFPNIISFSANETHWAFQTARGLFYGEIDTLPNIVVVPAGHLLVQYSYKGMITRRGFQRYWTPFDSLSPVAIPQGSKKPKIFDDSVYWHEDGVFYRWNVEHGTRQVCQMLEDVDDYLIGPNDWIAVPTESGVHFIQHGNSFVISGVFEVLFHSEEDKALLNRYDGVEIVHLKEERFSTQFLPECDELIGFRKYPIILGMEKRYFYSTSTYLQEPDGKGPEFFHGGLVMRNEHSVLGLSGSMWSWDDDAQPKWIQDLPDFDNGWVGDGGFLLIVDEQLLYVSNQGDFEIIYEDITNADLDDDDVLEIEELGIFVHHSRVEKSPVDVNGFPLDDSVQSWAWSQTGMWIDLR